MYGGLEGGVYTAVVFLRARWVWHLVAVVLGTCFESEDTVVKDSEFLCYEPLLLPVEF